MSISSTVKKFMPYLKTAKDYVLYRLSSQAVEMDDGTTLEQKVTSLNSLISQKLNSSNVVNNLTTTNSGYALDARQGKALNDSITSLNSALVDIRTMYLRRYYYQSTSGAWKALNIILPSAVSGYGYLPFIIVIGSGIYAINVVGGAVGGSLSPDGITYSKIIGADVSVSAIKEGSNLRIKFNMPEFIDAPVSIISLRQGVTISTVTMTQS